MPAGQADGPEALTFRRLVERNTLNMEPPRWAAGVLEEGASEWEVRAGGQRAAGAGRRRSVREERTDAAPRGGGGMNAPQNALLLIGSPKPKESTSESLGTYLSRSSRRAA